MDVTTQPEFLAAIDLGSNSFHMIVTRLSHGEPQVVDRLRERVALASGLNKELVLEEDAQLRALDCLSRLGQRVRTVPSDCLRAVGTYTLRRARNGAEFLRRAEEALGHEIEIIAGPEEARLIYLGVAHNLPHDKGRRLVIDIGGGSTECILGQGFETKTTDSLTMGCVSFSRRFFPEGRLRPKAFEKAVLAAQMEIETIERGYRKIGWENCVGSSGTIMAMSALLAENGWTSGEITLKGLRKLAKQVFAERQMDDVELPGLAEDRRDVLPGGLAVLTGLFESLRIESMSTSQGALRDGVVYDLLGRIRHEDVRERTIETFQRRYHVDAAQASQVETTVADLFQQAKEAWGLGPRVLQTLRWSAKLHEIGLSVSYAGYHKHSAYLVENSSLPGFSREDQALLATLIRSHRRKTSRALMKVRGLSDKKVVYACLLLRLAVRLNRGRSSAGIPGELTVKARDQRLRLRFPTGWLKEHPLTRADLEDEAEVWERVGVELRIGACDSRAESSSGTESS